MPCTRITKTPVVVNIPEACVHGVDHSESDECCLVRTGFVDAIDAQRHVIDDSCEVFATVEKVRELVARIPVPADTLQGTPDTWQAREETHGAQMR